MNIHEHIVLFAKGHYKNHTLADIVGKYTAIEPKYVEEREI